MSPTKHLEMLWRVAVRPVSKQLGLLKKSSRGPGLPRIWWIGGAIMSHLRHHAAGNQTLDTRENTMSHVLSSYVPNLRTLRYLRSAPPLLKDPSEQEILMVHMKESPGRYRPLNVMEEISAIRTHWESIAKITDLDRPGKQEVLEALRTCTIAHFACHGVIDSPRPLDSTLTLGRQYAERLTMEDVLDVVKRGSGQVAYLAACHTAEIKTPDFLHESLHLASAFQLAGFQHVVGTLWKAHDGTAAFIASAFYVTLVKEGTITGKSVSFALHNAILRFRQANIDNADWVKWAPFIHFGS